MSGRPSFLKQFLIYFLGKIIIFCRPLLFFSVFVLFFVCWSCNWSWFWLCLFFAFDQSARQSHGERTVKKQTQAIQKQLQCCCSFCFRVVFYYFCINMVISSHIIYNFPPPCPCDGSLVVGLSCIVTGFKFSNFKFLPVPYLN